MSEEYRKLYDAESDKVAVEAFLNGPDKHPRQHSPVKEYLLRRYADGTPTDYFQFDAFKMCRLDDSMMPADEDGHCLMGGSTVTELRNSGVDVRLQIRIGTNAKEALLMLEKLAFMVRQQVERGRTELVESEGYSRRLIAEMPFPELGGLSL